MNREILDQLNLTEEALNALNNLTGPIKKNPRLAAVAAIVGVGIVLIALDTCAPTPNSVQIEPDKTIPTPDPSRPFYLDLSKNPVSRDEILRIQNIYEQQGRPIVLDTWSKKGEGMSESKAFKKYYVENYLVVAGLSKLYSGTFDSPFEGKVIEIITDSEGKYGTEDDLKGKPLSLTVITRNDIEYSMLIGAFTDNGSKFLVNKGYKIKLGQPLFDYKVSGRDMHIWITAFVPDKSGETPWINHKGITVIGNDGDAKQLKTVQKDFTLFNLPKNTAMKQTWQLNSNYSKIKGQIRG